MQLVNGAKFLDTTCILLFPPSAADSVTIKVPHISIYVSQ